MLLYHGSNLTVDSPRLLQQTRGFDFGAGFYLTTSKEQAERFSEIIVSRRKSGTAIVSVYNFDNENAINSLNVRKFEFADDEWLEFVAENRLNTYSGAIYDMVIGAVANDIVIPTLQAYLNGFVNKEATLITPGILRLLMENRKLSLEDSADTLYRSQLYSDLENEATKLWRLGYPLLYDLLEEELTTGKITYPEEQI